eukprot:13390367-Heterocapsa_arctica.AAC.1
MPPLEAFVVLIGVFVGRAHDEDRAGDVCDRLVRDIQSGKVQEQGAPDGIERGHEFAFYDIGRSHFYGVAVR